MTFVRPVFVVAVLLPLLYICEVKRPGKEVGAVGSIELMVVMAAKAIATFNLKKELLVLSFFYSPPTGLLFVRKLMAKTS